MKIYKSDYVRYSRFIVRKLHKSNCHGIGSMYVENAIRGLPDKGIAKRVLDALVKQMMVFRKKKKHGWKYYLNIKKIDKIKEIIKEKGRKSIIPVLLCL